MAVDTVEWRSFRRERPKLIQYGRDGENRFRTFPILLQLNYHWVEETFIVLGYLMNNGGYWRAEAIPGDNEIPLDALVAWAYPPEGMDEDDGDYIWEFEDFAVTHEHLNSLKVRE